MAERMKKSIKLRYNEYYDMQKVFDELYSKSTRNENFKKLYEIVVTNENIRMALRKLSKNSGSRTAGTDGLTIEDILKLSDTEVTNKVRHLLETYNPKPVRRVEIPKGNDKTRPLGIPTIWDRLIQQCFLQILEPICEAKFHPQSYGFRSNKSCENAISTFGLRVHKSKLYHVVDLDIKSFFDNVNHGKLLKQLWTIGIRDKRIISIISKMLKAEIAEIGFPEIGTPQGGVISPLLANIVLNELDWWLSSQWDTIPLLSGDTNKCRKLKKTNLKRFYHIRYADDVKILCEDHDTAVKISIATIKWLKERLQLEISAEKSHITDLRKSYSSFLGFDIKAIKRKKDEVGNSKYVIRSRVQAKEVIRIHKKAQKYLKSLRYAKDENKRYEIVNRYNSFVIGTHNYYQYATMVAKDFAKIGYYINCLMKARYFSSLRKANGTVRNKYIQQRYGSSRGLLLYNGFPVVPVQYVGHKSPMGCNRKINPYTKEGRELIHKQLEYIDIRVLHYMMQNPIQSESIEYNDNRLSLYSAQKGNCSITGQRLDIGNMHCHHKKTRADGGTDKYENLTLIIEKVHTLIHAVKENTIRELLNQLNISAPQLTRVNTLRNKAGLEKISFGL